MSQRISRLWCPAVLVLIGLAGCSSAPVASKPQRDGTLQHGGSGILIAKSEPDLAEVTRISMTKDGTAETKMYRDGSAFKVPDGTKARVLDDDIMGGIHIKILSGPYLNQEGWVSGDSLK